MLATILEQNFHVVLLISNKTKVEQYVRFRLLLQVNQVLHSQADTALLFSTEGTLIRILAPKKAHKHLI